MSNTEYLFKHSVISVIISHLLVCCNHVSTIRAHRNVPIEGFD